MWSKILKCENSALTAGRESWLVLAAFNTNWSAMRQQQLVVQTERRLIITPLDRVATFGSGISDKPSN